MIGIYIIITIDLKLKLINKDCKRFLKGLFYYFLCVGPSYSFLKTKEKYSHLKNPQSIPTYQHF
jgi:hypothetical protein